MCSTFFIDTRHKQSGIHHNNYTLKSIVSQLFLVLSVIYVLFNIK